MARLVNEAYVAVRFTMIMDVPEADASGRALMERTRDPRRHAFTALDTLVVDARTRVLGRLRNGEPAERVLRELEAVLERRPDLAPPGGLEHLRGPVGEDAGERLYREGVERACEGRHDEADRLFARFAEEHPDHPLVHRAAYARLARPFLPSLPELQAAPRPPPIEAPARSPWPEVREANLEAIRAGGVWTDEVLGLPLVQVPAGTFAMGGSPAQKPFELPIRQVTLSRPWLMSAWPVTRAEWARFRPDAVPSLALEGHGAGVPMHTVSWRDAAAFCEWLREEDPHHRPWRLPTEAEWERAARGGIEGAPYPWGHEPIDERRANYAQPRPVPAGSYPPNAYGLFDMVGNVLEWCADYCAVDAYRRTPPEVTDPPGPTLEEARFPIRVLRGGACEREFMQRLCRNSRRIGEEEVPYKTEAPIGFRVVATVGQ